MKRLFLAMGMAGTLSCSDSSGPNVNGNLTFTYTGGGGGTFSAAGNAPSFTAPSTSTSWTVVSPPA